MKTAAKSSRPSLVSNYLYNVGYQILTMLLPLVTAPYLSRVLGAEAIGTYSYGYAIANYFVLFGLLGINNHGCRSIAAVNGDRAKVSSVFWRIYFVQLGFSILSLSAYIGFVLIACPGGEQNYVFILLALYVLSNCFDVNWAFFGLEQFKITTIRNAFIKLTAVVLVFAFVKNQSDLYVYTLIYAGSFLISQLLLWPFLLKRVDFDRPALRDIASEITPCLKLFVPVIAVSLYTGINSVMLGLFSTYFETGIFEYANRFFGIPIALLNSLGTVMMPRMVAASADGGKKSVPYMQVSFGFAMIISGAFSFGLIAIAPTLSNTFLGPDFSGCQSVLTVLCIASPFIAWANIIRTQYLIPQKRDNDYIVSVFIGCIVNLVLSYLLASRYGALGVSVSYLCAEMAVCLFQTWIVRKELPLVLYLKEGAPFLFIGLIMIAVVRVASSSLATSLLSLGIEICIGALTYLIFGLSIAIFSNNSTASYVLTLMKRIFK